MLNIYSVFLVIPRRMHFRYMCGKTCPIWITSIKTIALFAIIFCNNGIQSLFLQFTNIYVGVSICDTVTIYCDNCIEILVISAVVDVKRFVMQVGHLMHL